MEKIVLAVIGLGALYYVVRRLFKGESSNCACSGCGKANSCNNKKQQKGCKEQL